GSTLCKLAYARTNRPQPTSSTTANTTSSVTSESSRRRCGTDPVDRPPPPTSWLDTSSRVSWNTGTMPNSAAASVTRPNEYAIVRALTPSETHGGTRVGDAATSARSAHSPPNVPSAPDSAASARLSVRSWRVTRLALAPSATRTQI